MKVVALKADREKLLGKVKTFEEENPGSGNVESTDDSQKLLRDENTKLKQIVLALKTERGSASRISVARI